MDLDALLQRDTLDALEAGLAGVDPEVAREALLDAFFALVEYENVAEWNRLVRVCEALAIVGWGEVEAVDARAARWLNGRPYTDLMNRAFEKRFLSAGWSEMGSTFVLGETDRFYYASPERPDRPQLDTAAYAAARPTVDRVDHGVSKLASQRNPLARNPLRLTRSGRFYPAFEPLVDALLGLRHRLDRETRPERYGPGFGYLGILYAFSYPLEQYYHREEDVPAEPEGRTFVRERLALGRLAKAKGELRMTVTRYVPPALAERSLADQKREVADDLRALLDTLEARLKKRKADYDVPALRADLDAILDGWLGGGA